MSIINQALKKAQRERLWHEAQAVQHLVHLSPPRQPRRWFLLMVGCTVALGAGVVLHVWMTAATGRTPIAVKPQAAPRQPTMAVHREPMVPPAALQSPQAVTERRPAAMPAEPRIAPSMSDVRPLVDKPLMARAEDAQPRPAPADQQATGALSPSLPQSVAAPEAAPGGPVQQNRARARTLFNRALASQEGGDQSQALTLLQQVVELDPTLKVAYNSLGNLYYQQQQYQQAVAMYQKALAIDPDYAKARNNLGNTYMRLAMDDRALVELQKALQADGTYSLAYYNLACVYARAGDSETAAQYLQQAIALEPQARIWAQTDDDFARIRLAPVMQQLLGP